MKPISDYKRLTTLAAELELAGHFYDAQTLWHQAADVAVLTANRNWARVRAHFCQTQQSKNGGVA